MKTRFQVQANLARDFFPQAILLLHSLVELSMQYTLKGILLMKLSSTQSNDTPPCT